MVRAEDTELGHLLNDLQRNQFVTYMPAMTMRRDLLIREPPELIGDHALGFIQTTISEITASVAQFLCDALPDGNAVTFGHQGAGSLAGEENRIDLDPDPRAA